MMRSTFSSTTIASSTTMPIASTMPNSVSMLIEKPNRNMAANVPISDTGTASIGMMRGAPVLQEQQHHEEHQDHRLDQRLDDFLDRDLHVLHACRTESCTPCPWGSLPTAPRGAPRSPRPSRSAFAPGCRKIAIGTVGWPLSCRRGVVGLRAELDARDVLQPHDRRRRRSCARRSARIPPALPAGPAPCTEYVKSTGSDHGLDADAAAGELRVLLRAPPLITSEGVRPSCASLSGCIQMRIEYS